jgi:hypothetical protein
MINPKNANLSYNVVKIGVFIIVCLLIYPIIKSILIWFGSVINNPKEDWRTVSTSSLYTCLLSFIMIFNKYSNKWLWNKLEMKLTKAPNDRSKTPN